MAERRGLIVSGSVVLVAVAAGAYAWLDWSGRQPVAADDAAAIAEQAQLNVEAMQERLGEQIAGQPRTAVQERLDSPMGQALFRKCYEWTEFSDNHPGGDAEQHRDEACNDYRLYVDEGIVPE